MVSNLRTGVPAGESSTIVYATRTLWADIVCVY